MNCERNARKSMALAAVAVMVFSACAVLFCSEDTGAEGSGFDITDGTGRTFHYDSAADHVVIQGAGTALTVADAGYVGKIVATDKYSTYSYTKYSQLEKMDAVDLGSFYYATNHENIKTELLNLVRDGKMTLDDSIILTSYTANEALRTILEGEGFTHVLLWISISDFQGILDFVKDVSKIVSGGEPDSVKAMNDKVKTVEHYVITHKGYSAKALYVYYYKDVKIGNTGIMKSMLDFCNADNIGYDSSKGTSYGSAAEIAEKLKGNEDAVVFIQNSYFSAGYTIDDFRTNVLGGNTDIKLVKMGLDWNNWCPESVDGLYSIAQSLYGDDFDKSGGITSSMALYAGAALVIVLAIVGCIYFMKSKKA